MYQAYCGSCWSFSTTGCLEGAWFLADNELISLSEQQLVTCDTEWNQGCNGGWPSLSMIYINENGGVVPEDIYPYRKVGGWLVVFFVGEIFRVFFFFHLSIERLLSEELSRPSMWYVSTVFGRKKFPWWSGVTGLCRVYRQVPGMLSKPFCGRNFQGGRG